MSSDILDHWSNTAALSFSIITSPIGLILNLLLFYISWKYTPKAMETYSIVIRLGAIFDIFQANAAFLGSARVIPTTTSTYVMLQVYTSTVHGFMFSHLILIYSYCYRYLVVAMPFDQIDKFRVQVFCYTFSAVYFLYANWVYYMAISPQEELDIEILKVRPELVNSTWLFNGVIDNFRPSQILTGFLSVTTALFVLIVGGFCSFKINRSLKRMQTSVQLKLLHKSLLKVLLAQSISPIVSTITAIIYAVYQGVPSSRKPIFENMIPIPMVSTPVITPIVTFVFIEPYRVLIRLGVVFDIIQSISCFMTTARMIPTDTSTFFMMQGPCAKLSHDRIFSSRFCFYMYSATAHCFMFSHLLLIYTYIHRYRIVTMPFDKIDNTRIQPFCYLSAITYIVYCNWVYYMSLSPIEEVDSAIAKVRPELIGSDWIYDGVLDNFATSQILSNAMSLSTSWIVIVVGGFCSFRINRALNRIQSTKQVRMMHRSVLKVLLAQSISPFVSSIAVIIYGIYLEVPDSRKPLAENMITLPMISTTVITPAVTFLFIKPYREKMYRILLMDNNNKTSQSSMVSVVSTSQ